MQGLMLGAKVDINSEKGAQISPVKKRWSETKGNLWHKNDPKLWSWNTNKLCFIFVLYFVVIRCYIYIVTDLIEKLELHLQLTIIFNKNWIWTKPN